MRAPVVGFTKRRIQRLILAMAIGSVFAMAIGSSIAATAGAFVSLPARASSVDQPPLADLAALDPDEGCFPSFCTVSSCFDDGNICASTTPDVLTEFEIATDSTCTINASVNWGDGQPPEQIPLTATVPQSSGAPQPSNAVDLTHTYTKYGFHRIDATGVVASGECLAHDGETVVPAGAQYTITPFEPPVTYEFIYVPANGHFALAALGDSYSSGEGAGHYDGPPPAKYYLPPGVCDRSKYAWPRLLQSLVSNVEKTDLFACSGADSESLFGKDATQPNQIAELEKDESAPVFLVTITIGGNDIHFAHIAGDCLLHDCVEDGVIARGIRELAPGSPEMRTLKEDFLKISNAAPAAEVLVVGYPVLLPLRESEVTGCPWLSNAKRLGLIRLDGRLDTAIEEAVEDDGGSSTSSLGQGTREPGTRDLEFVDTSPALLGHELCTKEPWLNGLDIFGLFDHQEAHPNLLGQRSIATIVADYINYGV
jgi:hypothetical protein